MNNSLRTSPVSTLLRGALELLLQEQQSLSRRELMSPQCVGFRWIAPFLGRYYFAMRLMAVSDIKTVFLVMTAFARNEHNTLISFINASKTKIMPGSLQKTALTLTPSFSCWMKLNVNTPGIYFMLTEYGICMRQQLTAPLESGTRPVHQESQRMVDTEG